MICLHFLALGLFEHLFRCYGCYCRLELGCLFDFGMVLIALFRVGFALRLR